MAWIEICIFVYDVGLSIQIVVAADWFHILILLKLFIHSDFCRFGAHSAATFGGPGRRVMAADGNQAASRTFDLFDVRPLDHSCAPFVTIILIHLLGCHRNIRLT